MIKDTKETGEIYWIFGDYEPVFDNLLPLVEL